MMKNAMPMLFGMILAGLLAGCATPELSNDELRNIHRVAVVSAVGDTFDIHSVPLFGFGESDDVANIAAWDLDRYLTERVSEKLKGQYQVVPIKTPIHVEKGDPSAGWYFFQRDFKIDLPPGGDVGNGKVDTFIVFETGTGFPFNASQVHGPFMAQHPSAFERETMVGIAYDIVVVDAASGKELKRIAVPVAKKVDNSLWAEKFGELTQAQKDGILATLREVADITATKVLEIMKLTGPGEPI
jgi:hypothetical protein